MTPWLFPRVAPLALALALVAFASTPAAAQTEPSQPAPRSTVSTAPIPGAVDAAAPRRRPTPRRLVRPDSVVRTVSSPGGAAAANLAYLAMVETTLRGDGPNWIGIPYRWGGTTRRGIDCSAFVQQYVRQNLGIELPRTTAYQRYEGVEIDRDQLQAGDLVFFRRRGIRHVGVYLSDGEFIHASSSRGVTISNLSESYWTRHYWMSRRILNEQPTDRRPTPRSARG